jgi:hypothetical protein
METSSMGIERSSSTRDNSHLLAFLFFVSGAFLERARVLQNWCKVVLILLLPFRVQFELV